MEHLPEALAFAADQRLGPSRTSSKSSVNCFSGSMRSTGSSWLSSPGASVGTMNSGQLGLAGLVGAGARDTSSASASSTPEM